MKLKFRIERNPNKDCLEHEKWLVWFIAKRGNQFLWCTGSTRESVRNYVREERLRVV